MDITVCPPLERGHTHLDLPCCLMFLLSVRICGAYTRGCCCTGMLFMLTILFA